jgi:magnesium-transporting ATPase (P-type)
MPFQPFPTRGDEPSPQITGGPAPQSVLNAVKFMYAGAVLAVIGLIATIVSAPGARARIEKDHIKIHGKPATPEQITSLTHASIALGIAVSIIGVGLWLWMARKNGQGRSWARIVSTLLFVFSTLSLFILRSGGESAFSIVSGLLSWLVGLGAVVFLWLPASSAFFSQQRQ